MTGLCLVETAWKLVRSATCSAIYVQWDLNPACAEASESGECF